MAALIGLAVFVPLLLLLWQTLMLYPNDYSLGADPPLLDRESQAARPREAASSERESWGDWTASAFR
jgi:hypothetical protein